MVNFDNHFGLPLLDCFSKMPDFSYKYKDLKNPITLDEMNPVRTKLSGAALNHLDPSIRFAFQEIDKGYNDLLNRILWFLVKGKQNYLVEWVEVNGMKINIFEL